MPYPFSWIIFKKSANHHYCQLPDVNGLGGVQWFQTKHLIRMKLFSTCAHAPWVLCEIHLVHMARKWHHFDQASRAKVMFRRMLVTAFCTPQIPISKVHPNSRASWATPGERSWGQLNGLNKAVRPSTILTSTELYRPREWRPLSFITLLLI